MSTDNEQNKVEQLAAELAKANREIDTLKREKRRVGLSFHRIPETGHDISRLWNGDFPYLQKLANNSLEKQTSDPTFHADANTVLIEADNLAALMAMQLTHKGKVDVIYIDPPYNTGNNDFIYNDARKSSMKDVEGASASDYEANLDGKARMIGKDDPERHSLWLSFMERRLWLAKELLSDKGVIFISIDDNEYARLKVLMDSIFGETNLISSLVWKSKSGGANDSVQIATDHEYILVYGKNKQNAKFNLDKNATVTTSYNQIESDGRRYSLDRLDKQSLGYSKSLDFTILGPDGIEYKVFHNNPESPKARWRWGQDTVIRRYEELVFKDGKVYTKNYESNDGIVPRSLLVGERFGRSRTGSTDLKAIVDNFSFPKPVSLMKYLLSIASSADDTILDFFAGSGTTAQAVVEINKEDGGSRQCILVTHGDEDGKNIAEDVTAERMKRVLSGKNWADGKEHEPLTGSLYYYKLLFAPKTTNPLTAMETMQTRFTGLAALEQDTHVELENTQNYTVLMNSEKVVVVWKNEDALLDEPETEFYPLLERLKKEYAVLSHVVYTPSNQSSSSDEYGVESLGWINYSYPMEYIASHSALLERMKRNKTMLQPYADLQTGSEDDMIIVDEAHSSDAKSDTIKESNEEDA